MLEDVLGIIAQADFKQALLATTRELYEIERPFGFGAFERSGQFCFEKMREAGLDEVEVLEFPADGKASYWDKVIPPAWYPESGKLEVTSPAGAFRNPIIADYERCPFHLVMWSASTEPGGILTEIVTENMMLAGHSVKGRLVLAEPHHRPSSIFQAVCDRGGLGIVSDYVPDPFVTPDGVSWANSFRETPGWYPTAEDRQLLGFCISPRVGRKLRELLVTGTVKVRAEVKAERRPGKLLAPTGLLRGCERPDEEVWIVSHLYEPLGTDNSAGAGVALTAARVLRELVAAGKLRPPRRSIRFVLTLEVYGSAAVLKTLSERGKKLVATLVLDSPVLRPDKARGPMAIRLSPACNPLFSDRPIKQAVQLCLSPSSEVWKSLNATERPAERVELVFQPGYLGNDAYLGDPLAGGPSMHIWHKAGPYWHNSENTFELVPPDLLAAMVPVYGGLAYYLASLGPQDAPGLSRLVESESQHYLQETYNELPDERQNPEEFSKAIAFRMGLVGRRIASLEMWTDGDPKAASQQIADVRERINSFAQELLARAGAGDLKSRQPRPEELDNVDRRALTAVFRRKEPTFPMSMAFVADPEDKRGVSLDEVLARMDGERNLLDILQEVEYFRGSPGHRSGVLRNCLYLAHHGYLEARFTEIVTRGDLVAGMRRCGIEEGDLILAHSSVSAFGHVDGGAETVADALLEAVGPEGTVLVPTFTANVLSFEGYLQRRYNVQPYRAGRQRCWTGAVPRAFLKRKGVVRSAHPTHSVAGIGPLADACLRDQRLEDPPGGPSSAFGKLVEFDGKFVYAGASLSCSTFLHYLETKLDLPFLTGALCAVQGEDEEMEVVFVRQHLPGDREYYDSDWRNTKTFQALMAAGLELKRSEVGLGEIHTARARQFERKGLDVIGDDPTILLCDRPDCLFCRHWRRKMRKKG